MQQDRYVNDFNKRQADGDTVKDTVPWVVKRGGEYMVKMLLGKAS